MAQKFYNRIKEVIVQKRSSNKLLAEYLGYRSATISNWCRNAAQPKIPDMYKISEFFHVDVRELLVSTSWGAGPSPSDLAKEEAARKKPGIKVSKKKRK